ncbi:DUF1311 domain-containing protein [Oculatella sp. LEGE 06141]|uniref:lysozyme inhibitor LprI family protein n=1 Tax=Oculatella sp. LEGE 06141 TaxID=1828648 RepID=UPI00188171AF|nr:lysozyme inhibitor LprI family protein [Oculatella sp. LEGE 06141]MBE9179858.1 DUF1311 domain-containing protein [Oculatella sp. LEGE 06141]
MKMNVLKQTASLLVVAAIASAGTVRVSQAQSSAPQVNCQNAQSTPEINYCAEQLYQTADKALNAVYQEFRTKLGASATQKLTRAQRAWIRYRDANCEFETRLSVGGTGHPAYLNACLERMTKARTAGLQKQIESRQM